MSFFSNLVNTVADHVGDLVTDKVIAAIEPPVKEEVTERVNEFKTSAVEEIPRTIEAKITDGQDSDSAIQSLLSSLLSGQVGPLVEKVLKFLQPGIDNVSADLPDSITNTGTQYIREFLDFDLGQGQKSRGVGDEEGGGGFSDFIGDKLGDLGNLQEKIPAFLEKLREKLHPVFEGLKPKIWELVPGLVQQALQEVLNGDEQEQQPQEEQPEQRDRGFIGDLLSSTVKNSAIDQAPKLVELVQEPVQGIISNIVDKLENESNEAFSMKLVSALKEFNVMQ